MTTPWPEVNELLTNSAIGGLIAAGQDRRPPRTATPAQIAESQRILDAADHWLGESPPMPWLNDRPTPFHWADAISEARAVPGTVDHG